MAISPTHKKMTQETIKLPFMIGAIIAWVLRGYKKSTPSKQSSQNNQTAQKSNSFSGD